MKRFHVFVQERWERVMAVDAETEGEAIVLVYYGGGAEVSCQPVYVEDLPREFWTATEVELDDVEGLP